MGHPFWTTRGAFLFIQMLQVILAVERGEVKVGCTYVVSGLRNIE